MSEQNQTPRFSMVEIATDDDLRLGLVQALRKEGYGFNAKFPPPDGAIDFEAWKSNDPENTRIIITLTPGTADKEIIAKTLTHLGWYREQQRKPGTKGWVVAKSFTPDARYAAQVCPDDLTLKSYEVEISLIDGYRIASQQESVS